MSYYGAGFISRQVSMDTSLIASGVWELRNHHLDYFTKTLLQRIYYNKPDAFHSSRALLRKILALKKFPMSLVTVNVLRWPFALFRENLQEHRFNFNGHLNIRVERSVCLICLHIFYKKLSRGDATR